MNIKDFKRGDLVVRTESVLYFTGARDRSYIGEPMEFIKSCNGCAYLKVLDGPMTGHIVKLPLDVWQYGWDLFETIEAEDLNFSKLIESMKAYIEELKENEDYESLAKLRDLLN